jgi:3,4-dihydroxy 2-butanone 4-phosphate synthase/GTP cyclohydrolase II
MPLNTTEELIADIRAGRMVILMDDEDRENEGDLIMAASHVRPEDVNFMATHGRGLICLTLTRERCQRLRLPLMVNDNVSPHGTNFTLSIEAARGVTTGISAADRAVTIQAAASPDAKPDDLVQPGHIFPLMARPGGVLTRAGHTEAGCDLARLAGLEPAAAIVEILNEDGTMARRPDLERCAERHGLKIGTIADLIHYRVRHEKTVERLSEYLIETEFGPFRLVTYRDVVDDALHHALVRGTLQAKAPTLVRVHMQDTLCDMLGGVLPDCGLPLRAALKRVAAEGTGVVVVLRQAEDMQQLARRARGWGGEQAPRQEGAHDLRTYGIGAQILADLGVHQMRVISAPKRLHALSGFGLEVVEYVDAGEAGPRAGGRGPGTSV